MIRNVNVTRNANVTRTASWRLGAAALVSSLALASCAAGTVPGSGVITTSAARGSNVVTSGSNVVTSGSAVVTNDATGPRLAATGKAKKSKIQHIIVIVQENRSFDNLFQGFPGANTVSAGQNSKGQRVPLTAIPLEAAYQLDHSASAFFTDCNGTSPGQNCKMNGFNNETVWGFDPPANPEYGYVPAAESAPYFQMAAAYVLADNMFASNLDMSFASHQYIIAGQAESAVNVPNLLWGCGGQSGQDSVATLNQDRSIGPSVFPCFDPQTLADELDAAKLSWRYYAPSVSDSSGYIWSAFQAVNHIYNGPEWATNVISPPAQFLTDVGNGKLANMTWIVPTDANSDHVGSQSNTGPAWVTSLVNAVGTSKFWKSSAIFIMWDEWGGWYDHVPPPYEDYDGLGMRIPLIMISPYSKQGYVSHVQYEHGSILRFVEDNYGLAQLAASDARATSPAADAFDFSQKPTKFNAFNAQLKADYFLKQPPDNRPPDDD